MKRLKYISRFTGPMSDREIADLTEQSAQRNRELGVTGILMTTGGLFFQVIEGPEDAVKQIWDDIRVDVRHIDVLLLSEEEGVERRLFPDWSMRLVDLGGDAEIRTEPHKAMLENILQQQVVTQNLVQALERSIWNEMRRVGIPSLD